MKDDFTARVIRSLNWLQYGTNLLWVLIFRIFAIFQRSAKKGSRLKRYRKHSSRKNLLQSQEPIQILPSSFLPFLTDIYLFPFLQKLSFFPIFHPPRIIPMCRDFSWAVSGSAFDRRCVDRGSTLTHLAAREKKPLDTRVRIQEPYNWLTSHS